MKNNLVRRWLGCTVIAVIIAFSMQVEASSQPFKDVSSENPYREMIQDMLDRKLINGFPDGTFKPNENISRKHVARLLDNALKLESKSDTIIHYKDVPKNHPYYNAISNVSQAGIFNGDSKGNFNPDAPLTRIQMAKVLDLAFNPNIKSFSNLPDVNKGHWGYTHVQALYSNGITTADQGYFRPDQPVTRAHYAVFLYRALRMPKEPKSLPNAKLTKEEIVNLVYRLPTTVETSIVDHKHQASRFSVSRTELLKYSTEPFIDQDLKKYYENMCMYCDMNLFPFIMNETNYRFEILENTPNLVRVHTVSFAAPLKDAGYVRYGFEKHSGMWKLSGYDWLHLGAGSFELTKEEALRIVKKDYLHHAKAPVEVRIINTEYDYINDWYTKQDYRRLVYRMYVDSGERSFNIVFYPHNGSYDEQE